MNSCNYVLGSSALAVVVPALRSQRVVSQSRTTTSGANCRAVKIRRTNMVASATNSSGFVGNVADFVTVLVGIVGNRIAAQQFRRADGINAWSLTGHRQQLRLGLVDNGRQLT